MRFYFDLDDNMMEYYDAQDFQGDIRRAAVQAVAESELERADREVQRYFEQMIYRAIARKFNK